MPMLVLINETLTTIDLVHPTAKRERRQASRKDAFGWLQDSSYEQIAQVLPMIAITWADFAPGGMPERMMRNPRKCLRMVPVKPGGRINI
jgi:hypothetical protein